jgi:hypothetical protein
VLGLYWPACGLPPHWKWRAEELSDASGFRVICPLKVHNMSLFQIFRSAVCMICSLGRTAMWVMDGRPTLALRGGRTNAGSDVAHIFWSSSQSNCILMCLYLVPCLTSPVPLVSPAAAAAAASVLSQFHAISRAYSRTASAACIPIRLSELLKTIEEDFTR